MGPMSNSLSGEVAQGKSNMQGVVMTCLARCKWCNHGGSNGC